MGEAPRRARGLVLDVWPALLALLLCGPLLVRPGHPLARDLVAVPHQPWGWSVLGLGGAAPRAVPLDAVVSALTHVVDGGVLVRVAIPLLLAAAGWGAHRLVGGLRTGARLAAGGFAVWNPFVVERLALGQWALLSAYAALPWLVVAATRARRAPALRPTVAPVVGWSALAALTPTGGLLAAATLLVLGSGRSRRAWVLALVGVAVNVPWLAASLAAPVSATSDPAGVESFASRGGGPGGVLVSVLGTGGIWDAGSTPGSQDSWGAVVAAAVVTASLVVLGLVLRRPGARSAVPGDGWRPAVGRLAWLALGGLVLAFLPSVPGGAEVMRWAVEHLPGAGLLRDAQKWVAPYAVLAIVALAVTVHVVLERVESRVGEPAPGVALPLLLLPLLALPDATRAVWPTVSPVPLPAGLSRVVEAIGRSPEGHEPVATLPWRSYRLFSWGSGLTSSDPLVRMLAQPVVTSDALVVGRRTLAGESRWSARVGSALARQPVAEALRGNGVRWAVVYGDDPAVDDLDLQGAQLVLRDPDVALYRVPGTLDRPRGVLPSAATRGAVAGADLAAVLVLLGVAGAGRPRRRSRGGSVTPS